jgi:hypothetical protein
MAAVYPLLGYAQEITISLETAVLVLSGGKLFRSMD